LLFLLFVTIAVVCLPLLWFVFYYCHCAAAVIVL